MAEENENGMNTSELEDVLVLLQTAEYAMKRALLCGSTDGEHVTIEWDAYRALQGVLEMLRIAGERLDNELMKV